MIQTIVVPVLAQGIDHGQIRAVAIPVARELAELTNAAVCLVSVVDRDSPDWRNHHRLLPPDADLGLPLDSPEALLAETAAQFPVGRAEHAIRSGETATEVLLEAGVHPHPLIVVAASGQNPLSSLIDGDATLRILRNSSCPVLVVRPNGSSGPAGTPNFSPAVVPILHATADAHTVKADIDTLGPAVRHVHLLHVIEPLPRIGRMPAEVLADTERNARTHLERVAERVAEHGRRVTWEVRVGRSATHIEQTAVEQRANLIVMGLHMPTGKRRFFKNSMAMPILRQAQVPLFLVRNRPEAAQAITRESNDGAVNRSHTSHAIFPRVGEIMTQPIIVVHESDPLVDVVRTMLDHRIDSLAVTDAGGVLRGVVTSDDFVGGHGIPVMAFQLTRCARSGSGWTSFEECDKSGRVLTAASAMTDPEYVAFDDEPADTVIERMAAGELRQVPVVDARRRPIGIVTRRDLLKVLAPEPERRSVLRHTPKERRTRVPDSRTITGAAVATSATPIEDSCP